MKNIRLILLLLVLVMLLSVTTPAVLAAGQDTPETTEAVEETEVPWAEDPSSYRQNLLADAPDYEAGCETALLIELNSGIVAYAKNAEEVVYPASLTKIMTCMIALQYAGNDLDKMVTVSDSALAGIAEAGGEVRLLSGERMTLRDVLYYMMVVSANEASNVVAEYVAGDIPSFIQLMNKTAKELGCTNTHFSNAHGLHDSNHYTTARDLSIIVRKAMTYEVFREICATVEYVVPETNLSASKKLTTTNFLILNNGDHYLADNGNYYTYYYAPATGIKTGYTSAAGRCVVSRANDGNLDLLCIIMGAETRLMSDGSIRYDNFVEAKKLFNYGFDNFSYAKVILKGIRPMFSVPVKYANEKRGAVLVPSSDVNCLLPKNYDPAKVTTDYKLDDPDRLAAPLAKHQKVGTVNAYYNGTFIGSADLETLTEVEEKTVEHAIADITGSEKPDNEKSFFQSILTYWYVPVLAIAGLFVILTLRNIIYRLVRRRAVRKQRERIERRARRGGGRSR